MPLAISEYTTFLAVRLLLVNVRTRVHVYVNVHMCTCVHTCACAYIFNLSRPPQSHPLFYFVFLNLLNIFYFSLVCFLSHELSLVFFFFF